LAWGRAIATIPSYIPSSPTPHAVPGLFAPTLALEQVTSTQLVSEQFTSDEERALNLYRTGDFAAAVQEWQNIADRSTDGIDRAIALGNLSLCWQKLGQWNAATEAIAQSWQQMSAAPAQPDTLQIQAQLLTIQGSLDFALGDYANALDRWEESEELYEQLGDRDRATRSRLNQVQAMQGLGLYRRAEKTLAAMTAQLNEQPDSALKATQWRSLGNVLRVLGNVGTLDAIGSTCQLRVADLQPVPATLSAATAWQQSLAVAMRLNLPEATSEAYLGLGNVARAIYRRELQNPDAANAATEAAQTAIACHQNAANAATPLTRVRAQLNTMSLLLEQEADAAEAVELSRIRSQLSAIDRAAIEATLNTLPPGRTGVYTRIELAQNLMKMAVRDNSPVENSPIGRDAERLLLTAVDRANTLGDPRVRSQALGTLGELYSMQREGTQAKSVTEKALAIAQSMQADDLSYQWQWQLGRILKNPLNNNPVQADTTAAIAAYDGAVKTLQSLRRDLVAIEQEAQFDFRDRVEPVYREFVDLLLQSPNPSQANLMLAREVIEGLQLAELDNFFRDACSKAKPQPIEQIDASTVAIYGIILDDRLEVIVRLPHQTDDELFHYRTPIPKAELVRAIDKLRSQLEKASPRDWKLALPLSQQIYTGLLAPALEKLQGEETLVFVLDGELRNIPMAALYDGKQYLIERHPVAIEPGLHLLDPQLLSRPFNALLAGLSQAPGFSSLPNVPRELEIIEQIIKTSGGVVSNKWLDGEFNRQNLENRVGSQPLQLVHLATHGQFTSQAENTFFLAADGPINIKQLEPIFGSRNPRQSKSIDLLFISACETAKGDDRAVLGLAGVAVRAGARSTIASIWSLPDESATEFIGTFYQELVSGTPRAEALRRAQLKFLKGGWNAPLYWAPYVLLGDWR
jgi:CHAT domain-containing protein/tetratricopeptide (TPR) repeat protein